jgi:hypothetical protein
MWTWAIRADRIKNSKSPTNRLISVGATSSDSPLHEAFRANAKVRRQPQSRKRRIARRVEQADRSGMDRPEMAATNIQYEIANRTRTINAGGIDAAHLLVKRLGLDEAINERLDLLEVHLPYHESDHILSRSADAPVLLHP